MAPTATAHDTTERRVRRLNAASAARVVEPDVDLPGHVGDGQLLPDDLLLSAVGLDRGSLTPEQMVTLGRETVASIAIGGIQFEGILMAGFGLQIARSQDCTDPRITYLLHELGEETRHSRLFVRLVEQIGPTARNPLAGFPVEQIARFVIGRVISWPALLYTMVLAGEEIPDLMQKLAAEHPDTDPFVKAVNTYHRQEEARHLAFARLRLPEVW
ncbi:MAG TPA: diiron oxygenase, partial [Acidimicrobiales bacterium]